MSFAFDLAFDFGFGLDPVMAPAGLVFAPDFNAATAFIDRHLAQGRTDKVALRWETGILTYGQLAREVNRCGSVLKGLELSPGARVLMIVDDCPEFLFTFWGAIKAGLVPVPVNTLLRTRDFRFMIDDSGCEAVVFSSSHRTEAEPAIDGTLVRWALSVERLREVMAEASPDLDAVPAGPLADCFWLYSSGTTGQPKAAVHSHRNMAVTSQCYGVGVLGMTGDDVCFSAAKLFFAYGLGNAMTFPLWVGASAVLASERPTPAMTFDIIARHRPTLFFGVPTLYAAQLRAMDEMAPAPDLSSLRLCVSAGEALPADICRRWYRRTGIEVLDGIGSTEALHIFISNRPGDVMPGSSGREVPGYRARIVDDGGAEVAPGQQGSLLIQGDSVALRYWNNPERTAATMGDGWLRTGDTYVRDEAGYYHYRGRGDDMLKVGGLWCSPFEVEGRLVEHPAVLEAAVIGRADADDLVKPEAFVVLADGLSAASPSLALELLEHCKSGLAPYKFPRRIHFVADLPKTATGKIQRFKLRQAAKDRNEN